MRNRTLLFVSLIVLLVVVAVPFLMSPAQAAEHDDEPLRVAFVYSGPVGDLGWVYAHDLGRQYAEEQLGDRIETVVVEDIPPPDSEHVFEDLARDGYDLIFGTTSQFQDHMISVAEQYPDVKFANASGWKTADNVDQYFTRLYQSSYLAGIVAGHQTEADHVGYVAAHPIPFVLQSINGYAIGVWEANPEAEVQVIWTDSWFDPPTEREAAMSLLDAGADVLTSDLNSPAVIQAVEERGAWGIGAWTDMCHMAPDGCLTTMVHHWGVYYEDKIRSVLNDNWEVEVYLGGISDGVIDLSPLSEHVVPEAREHVERARERFHEDPEFDVFRGPLSDQEGNLIVEEGETLGDRELAGMDYLLEGIQGNL